MLIYRSRSFLSKLVERIELWKKTIGCDPPNFTIRKKQEWMDLLYKLQNYEPVKIETLESFITHHLKLGEEIEEKIKKLPKSKTL